MVNFVILEDNELHLKRTEDIVKKYMMKNTYDYTISKFKEVNEEFEKLINKDENYIYILDFELENTTAIDVARKIRENDWISPIIVYTVNGGMAFETLKQRLQILDFVSKQFEGEKNLFELFDICFKQLKVRDDFKYKTGKSIFSINYDKILYIYKDTFSRKSVIVTDSNIHYLPVTLNSLKDDLPEYFKYSHKSCIVNTKRVEAYNFKDKLIVFDNGKTTNFLTKKHKSILLCEKN